MLTARSGSGAFARRCDLLPRHPLDEVQVTGTICSVCVCVWGGGGAQAISVSKCRYVTLNSEELSVERLPGKLLSVFPGGRWKGVRD